MTGAWNPGFPTFRNINNINLSGSQFPLSYHYCPFGFDWVIPLLPNYTCDFVYGITGNNLTHRSFPAFPKGPARFPVRSNDKRGVSLLEGSVATGKASPRPEENTETRIQRLIPPFFSATVLFQHQPFPRGFWWFSRRIVGKNGGATPKATPREGALCASATPTVASSSSSRHKNACRTIAAGPAAVLRVAMFGMGLELNKTANSTERERPRHAQDLGNSETSHLQNPSQKALACLPNPFILCGMAFGGTD